MTKYYFLGGARVALRQGGALYYPLTDHLGSTSVTTDSLGNAVAELRYTPWGETRLAGGTTPSKYQFTGQYNEGELGLYYYNARWYDPYNTHFTQPDSIIPPGVQGLDRYAYANNSPIVYSDPDGHCPTCLIGAGVGVLVGGIGYGAYAVYSGKFNGWHMAAAVASGAVAGALIGSGIGAVAGVSAAEATVAGTTAVGAAETANVACGGDMCAGEIQVGTQELTETGPALARSLGQAGEIATGIMKNTEHITSLTGTANYRIPDQLLKNQSLISEVKNVANLSYTNQIKDFLAYSEQEGYTFELWTRNSTILTKTLQRLIESGRILHRFIKK